MIIRDAVGNELKEGDVVSLAVGEELGAGTVQKIDSGLGITQTGQGVAGQQPSIFIGVTVQKPVLPNGIAVGVLKIAKPEPSVAL